MCLDTVSKVKPRHKKGFGWKVFEVDSEGSLFPLYYLFGNTTYHFTSPMRPIEIGKTYKNRRKVLIPIYRTYFLKSYSSGFHVFKRRRDAENYSSRKGYQKVCKVEYKNPTSYGTQGGREVIIAQQMKVLCQ